LVKRASKIMVDRIADDIADGDELQLK